MITKADNMAEVKTWLSILLCIMRKSFKGSLYLLGIVSKTRFIKYVFSIYDENS